MQKTKEPPAPPEELTPAQVAVWQAVTGNLSGEWFPPETYPLLAQYCRHVVAARRLAKLITAYESTDPFEIREYDRLLRMQEVETRAIGALATKMRITQQAIFTAKTKKPSQGRRPWDAG